MSAREKKKGPICPGPKKEEGKPDQPELQEEGRIFFGAQRDTAYASEPRRQEGKKGEEKRRSNYAIRAGEHDFVKEGVRIGTKSQELFPGQKKRRAPTREELPCSAKNGKRKNYHNFRGGEKKKKRRQKKRAVLPHR